MLFRQRGLLLIPLFAVQGIELHADGGGDQQDRRDRHPRDEDAVLRKLALHARGESRVVAEPLRDHQERRVGKADRWLRDQRVDAGIDALAPRAGLDLVIVDDVAVHDRHQIHAAGKAAAAGQPGQRRQQ